MPTLRNASLCALTAIVLFSCNNQKSTTTPEQRAKTVIETESAGSEQGNHVDFNEYQTKFIESATQHFTVSSKKKSFITCKQGLKIDINPAVLEREDGAPLTENITVNVLELTNVNDLFKSNAATVCNGKLLVSGGSYYVDMENGGSKVRIKDGQAVEMQFPVVAKENMELFYGNRDANGNMDWVQTGKELQQNFETISFNTNDKLPTYFTIPEIKIKKGQYLCASLTDKVIFLNRMTTVQNMVHTMQQWGKDKIIDTVYYSFQPGCQYKNIRYTRYTGGDYWNRYSGMLFRVNSSKESQAEKDSLNELYCEYLEKVKAEKKIENFKDQLAKNYAPEFDAKKTANYRPVRVANLGWINCDRFYNVPQQEQTELELPYALNNSRMQYFVMFRNLNSLLNGTADFVQNKNIVLQKLPVGEKITLVAFIKKNGVIYHAKQDFNVAKNKRVEMDFKEISADEVNKMFGPNVKI